MLNVLVDRYNLSFSTNLSSEIHSSEELDGTNDSVCFSTASTNNLI